MQKGRLIEKYMSLLCEEIPLSQKLELYRANQDQIRNQRPRIRRNTLILGRKAGGGISRAVPNIFTKKFINIQHNYHYLLGRVVLWSQVNHFQTFML